MGPGDLGEVGEPDLERHRPGGQIRHPGGWWPRRRPCAGDGGGARPRSQMSVAKVSSCPIDLAAWSATTGRGSSPRARPARWAPERRAQIAFEGAGRKGGDVADGGDAEGVEAPAGHRPDSPQRPDRQADGGSRAPPRAATTTTPRPGPDSGPVGAPAWPPSDASLAINLRAATPTEQESSSSSAHPLADGFGDGRAVSQQLARSGHVQEGLVEGDALDQRRHDLEDGVQAPALLHVAVEPSVGEDGRRAQAPGHRRRHGRVDAEHTGLIGAGGHHAAPSAATDDDRQTGQGRIVEHLHRGEEGVHVHMEDDPVGGTRRLPVTGPARGDRPVSHRAAADGNLRQRPRRPAGRHPRRSAAPPSSPTPPRRGTGCDDSRRRRPSASTVVVISTHTSGSRVPDSNTVCDLVGRPGFGEVVGQCGGGGDGVEGRPSGHAVVPVVEVLLSEEDGRRIGTEHDLGAQPTDDPTSAARNSMSSESSPSG